jgi:hypothetical protein
MKRLISAANASEGGWPPFYSGMEGKKSFVFSVATPKLREAV